MCQHRRKSYLWAYIYIYIYVYVYNQWTGILQERGLYYTSTHMHLTGIKLVYVFKTDVLTHCIK